MARTVAAILAGESHGRGEPAARDLVEQRLKQMKIAPVNQGHRYGYVF